MNSLEALISLSMVAFVVLLLSISYPPKYYLDSYAYSLANDVYNLAYYYKVVSLEEIESYSSICIEREEKKCGDPVFMANRVVYYPLRKEVKVGIGEKI